MVNVREDQAIVIRFNFDKACFAPPVSTDLNRIKSLQLWSVCLLDLGYRELAIDARSGIKRTGSPLRKWSF